MSNFLSFIIVIAILLKTFISKKETQYHLVTYSTTSHDWYAMKLIGTAHIGGFNFTKHMKPADIDNSYVIRNIAVLGNITNGPGGWIWKPYVIFKYMIQYAKKGDVVCYCDSRYMFKKSIISSINALLEAPPHIAIPMNKPAGGTHLEKHFSKGDAFGILGVDGKDVRESPQAWAGFNCYRVSFRTLQFVAEWYTYTQDGRVIHGTKSQFVRNDEVLDNQEDQTVLSLLAKKWKIKFFRVDDNFGLLNCRAGQCDYVDSPENVQLREAQIKLRDAIMFDRRNRRGPQFHLRGSKGSPG